MPQKWKSNRSTSEIKPTITLKRILKTDVFEGRHQQALALRIRSRDTDHAGKVRRTRDSYSFLPTLGESDLYLFGKGDERRIYDKLGSQLRTIDGVPLQLRGLGSERTAH